MALVLVVALGSLLSWLIVRGFPDREGSAPLAGLSAPVRVVRDANGIAHIYASTAEDLFAAQGWVHASERMWQMEVWRRIGSGRLAELFGADQLATDHYIRVLGWRTAAEADLGAMSPDGRAALEAYARGVNAWLDAQADLPLPFVIAGYLGAGGGLAGFRPEPWTPVDTLTWQKVQAYSLGSDIDRELFRHLALRRGISEADLERLLPAYDMTRPVIVPQAESGALGGARPATGTGASRARAGSAPGAADAAPAARLLEADARLRAAIGLPGGVFGSAGLLGSNGWAVAPARSATGHAQLANDPHLGISMPSVWYMVGLHCRPLGPGCPYELAGAGFPGVPGIVIGHNARIAWGLTNVGPDVMDLFAERLDPADADRYEYRGESRPFERREELIEVAGADPVSVVVRSTVHGPVLSDVQQELGAAEAGGAELGREGYVYAVAWAATAEADRTFESVLAVNRAQDWQEFRAALRDFGAPSQTFVYADVDGHIGVQVPGRIPLRAAGDGSRPAPGEDGAFDWTGWVPFDELPYLYDPPSGLIVAANNLPSDDGPFLGRDFDPGYRAARIVELIDHGGPLTTELSRRIQGDTVLTRAAAVIAATQRATPATADGRHVLDTINAWLADLDCNIASAGCAAYEAFEYRLLRGLVDDELGAGSEPDNSAWRWVGSEVSHEALVRLVAAPTDRWWDDTTTSEVETRDQIVARALDHAGHDLRDTLGEPAAWTWGRIHTVTFREETLGRSGVGPLEALFNRGPFPAPGSCTTLNKICGPIADAYPPGSEPADLRDVFAASSGPSLRFVVDLGDLGGASMIQATGQSGLPFEGHYGDFIDAWLANDGIVVPWSDGAVESAARQELLLTP